MQIALIIILAIAIVAIGGYCYLFYPQQIMPIGEPVEVATVEPEKYHNDCLHPCIRYCEKNSRYYMAQSPYYGWDKSLENPMYYESDDCRTWEKGTLIADTPEEGFNTDPCIFVDKKGQVTYIWRESKTRLTYSLNGERAIVGGRIEDGQLLKKQIFAVNAWKDGDTVQCPIMMERNGEYYIYAAWYQYEPIRKNMGVAMWKGTSLEKSDFKLVNTEPFESICTVDRMAQVRLYGRLWFVPKPLRHDLWHFDLFEYEGKLYMVSVAEKGDNIMLSVSDDWVHFKTYRKPLVNNHYTENYCGYRQYYYKPTAFVKDNTLHLFYTANAKDDPKRNQLYHTAMAAKNVLQ